VRITAAVRSSWLRFDEPPLHLDAACNRSSMASKLSASSSPHRANAQRIRSSRDSAEAGRACR